MELISQQPHYRVSVPPVGSVRDGAVGRHLPDEVLGGLGDLHVSSVPKKMWDRPTFPESLLGKITGVSGGEKKLRGDVYLGFMI